MLKAIIIDDEDKSREIIRIILEEHCKSLVVIIGEAIDVKTGIQEIVQKKPDLVFLDINLPDGSGFDLIKSFRQIDFKIIFITAYEEFAVQAIRFSALDFIVKPIHQPDLLKAVEKANEIIKKEEYDLRIQTLLDNFETQLPLNKKIILKSSEKVYIVNISEIIRCESQINYTVFFMKNDLKILMCRTLKEYEDLLDNYHFIRIHQSHLINIHFVRMYDKKTATVELTDGSKIPISSRKKEKLLELIENTL